MNKKTFLLFALLILINPQLYASDEELFARRIIEFWKDKEYPIVKRQIIEFIENYPESSFKEHFQAILGDLYLKEKKYSEALNVYQKITNPAISIKTEKNVLLCLYQLKKFDELAESVKNKVDDSNFLYCLYYAESLLRKSLEKTPTHLDEARLYYEKLLHSNFRPQAQMGLAEIAKIKGEQEKAQKYFAELFEETPLRSELTDHALIQWLQIVFNLNQFDEIISKKDELLSKASQKSYPLVLFYLGQSFLHKKDFNSAFDTMETFFKSPSLPQLNNQAYLCFLQCSYYCHKWEAFDQTFEKLQNETLTEKEHLYIIYLKALEEHQKGNNENALIFFDSLVENETFASQSYFENGCIEYLKLLFEEKMWQKSLAVCQIFWEMQPDNFNFHNEVLPYFINSSLSLINDPDCNETLCQKIISQINLFVLSPKEVHKENKGYGLLVQSKGWLNLKRHQEAINLLNQFIDTMPEHPQAYLAHTFLALCYQKQPLLEKTVYHAEQALKLHCPQEEKKIMQMTLFNAYKDLYQETACDAYLDNAAKTLYELYQADPDSIETDNHLWLALYYFKKQEPSINSITNDQPLAENTQKSIRLFEKFLQKNPSHPDALYQLSQLYCLTAQSKSEINLLEKLVFSSDVDHSNHLYFQGKLALAHAYLKIKKVDLSKILYCELETECPDPSICYTAQLFSSRIRFGELSSQALDENSDEIIGILKKLKDIQVRKNLLNEPIHLEAALEYAFFRSHLASKEEKFKKLLFLLERIKEDFTVQNDILSKDYHCLRSQYPQKDLIYQAYMRLVDANLLKVQSEIAKSEGNISEAELKANTARALFATLRQGKYAVNAYIIDHAITGMER